MLFGKCVLCDQELDPSLDDLYQPEYVLLDMWVGDSIIAKCVHPRCKEEVQRKVDELNRMNLEKANGKEAQ